MSKLSISLLVVAGLLAAAVASNPSADKHRTKIKEVIAERSQLEMVFGVGHLTAFASKYHSIWMASYTTVNEETTSVGAFGMVFVLD